MSEVINLNDLQPPPPAGSVNVKWQKGPQSGVDPTTGLPVFPVSAYVGAGSSGGGGGGGSGPALAIPVGPIDGSNLTYTLPFAPSVSLYTRNGVIQNPLLATPDYSIAGTTLTVAKPLYPASATQALADVHLIFLWP